MELFTESMLNTVDCKGGSLDSHSIAVAGIFTVENYGAGPG